MKEIVEIRDLATVITNLLSAIPWVGSDLVEFSHLLLIPLFILAILPAIGTVVLRFYVELYLVLKMITCSCRLGIVYLQ